MPPLAPSRRAVLGLSLGSAAALLAPRGAHALDAPEAKPVLTINGTPAKPQGSANGPPNGSGVASFDIAELQKLPAQSFSTRTPWYSQPRRFTGVALRDLLAAAGAAEPTHVKAGALNDYRVDIPIEDFTRHGAIVAYLLDDKPMPVREKGPLVIIYPFDDKPELRTAVYYSRAIWQLRSLDLK